MLIKERPSTCTLTLTYTPTCTSTTTCTRTTTTPGIHKRQAWRRRSRFAWQNFQRALINQHVEMLRLEMRSDHTLAVTHPSRLVFGLAGARHPCRKNL